MLIAVPPGIGDAFWALTKIPAMLREAGESKADLIVADNAPRRSKEFLEAFDFIGKVEYKPLRFTLGTHKCGRYNYWPTRSVHPECAGAIWLIPNEHLEQGLRLETWLTEYEIDWHIQERFLWQESDLDFAAQLKQRLGEYVVFYLGPEEGNTTGGHNRGGIWSMADWVTLGLEIGKPIVVVGAEYDRSYSNKVLDLAHARGSHWLDYVGRWPIGRTFAVVREAAACISYQSGIGIFATYLRVPTAMWWRAYGDSCVPGKLVSFHEDMRTAWVPPDMLDRGKYLGMIYGRCEPGTVLKWNQITSS